MFENRGVLLAWNLFVCCRCQVHWQEQRKTPTSTSRFLAKLDGELLCTDNDVFCLVLLYDPIISTVVSVNCPHSEIIIRGRGGWRV